MHEEQDIRNMGGLRRQMPLTFWTFVVASFANAGLVPFAGFWSKDEIILGSWISDLQPIGQIVSVVGLISAFLTGLYMFWLVLLTFGGEPRYDTAHIHPHESPPSMAVPLVLLAIPSLLVGFVGFPPEDGPLHHFLEPVFADEGIEPEGEEVASLVPIAGATSALQAEESTGDEGTHEEAGADEEHAEEGAAGVAAEGEHAAEEEHHVTTAQKLTFAIISSVVALGGILLAVARYRGAASAADIVARDRSLTRGAYDFLLNKWRWDELYDAVLVRPLSALAVLLWRVVDVGIIDATVNGVATGIGAVSQRLRHVQTGLLANYALGIAIGMVVLVGVYLGLFSNLFR
jgi:NADH-quinone oxidoreductase subunit L